MAYCDWDEKEGLAVDEDGGEEVGMRRQKVRWKKELSSDHRVLMRGILIGSGSCRLTGAVALCDGPRVWRSCGGVSLSTKSRCCLKVSYSSGDLPDSKCPDPKAYVVPILRYLW